MPKKTLVLGASPNPARYSHMAVRLFDKHNMDVVAVGFREDFIEDIKIHDKPVHFEDIDTITLYLGAKNQVPYYDYIIGLHPRRIIFNPGSENPELDLLARKNHIEVMYACTLVLLNTYQY
jgi:predicted CoA-binding protein